MEISERQAIKLWTTTDRTTECWLWTGRHDKQGYGWLYADGMPRRTHRMAWTVTHGQIPDNMNVLHTCDNPPCINPKHLWLGTQKQNVHDRMAKGRPGSPGMPRKYTGSKQGIYWCKAGKRQKRWKVITMIGKKQKHLGYFKTKEEATTFKESIVAV